MEKVLLLLLGLILFSSISQADDVKASSPVARFEYHLALELLPLVETKSNPAGAGFGLVFENWHLSRELISLIGVEADQDYNSQFRTDVIATFGLLARVTEGIYLGARLGVVTNNPGDPSGFGAVALRALLPITPNPGIFGALFTEADLGVSGTGNRYGAVRFGLKIL
jgi:hypothetical protein